MVKHERDCFYPRWNTSYARSVSSEWIYAIGRQEEEDGKTFVSDKRDWAITCVFCRDLLLTLMFSCLLQKDLLKGRWSLGESFFKQNYCQLCHKACRLLSSPVLLLKFSNISSSHEEGGATKPTECFFHTAFEVIYYRTASNYRLFCCLVRFVIE